MGYKYRIDRSPRPRKTAKGDVVGKFNPIFHTQEHEEKYFKRKANESARKSTKKTTTDEWG